MNGFVQVCGELVPESWLRAGCCVRAVSRSNGRGSWRQGLQAPRVRLSGRGGCEPLADSGCRPYRDWRQLPTLDSRSGVPDRGMRRGFGVVFRRRCPDSWSLRGMLGAGGPAPHTGLGGQRAFRGGLGGPRSRDRSAVSRLRQLSRQRPRRRVPGRSPVGVLLSRVPGTRLRAPLVERPLRRRSFAGASAIAIESVNSFRIVSSNGSDPSTSAMLWGRIVSSKAFRTARHRSSADASSRARVPAVAVTLGGVAGVDSVDRSDTRVTNVSNAASFATNASRSVSTRVRASSM